MGKGVDRGGADFVFFIAVQIAYGCGLVELCHDVGLVAQPFARTRASFKGLDNFGRMSGCDGAQEASKAADRSVMETICVIIVPPDL